MIDNIALLIQAKPRTALNAHRLAPQHQPISPTQTGLGGHRQRVRCLRDAVNHKAGVRLYRKHMLEDGPYRGQSLDRLEGVFEASFGAVKFADLIQ